MSDEEGLVKILSNWALYKVSQKDIEDEKIALMIKTKLGDTPGISYAEIARCALSAGRPSLAIKVKKSCFDWIFKESFLKGFFFP